SRLAGRGLAGAKVRAGPARGGQGPRGIGLPSTLPNLHENPIRPRGRRYERTHPSATRPGGDGPLPAAKTARVSHVVIGGEAEYTARKGLPDWYLSIEDRRNVLRSAQAAS